MSEAWDVYERNKPYAKPGPYETPLRGEDELAFLKWVHDNKVPYDPTEDVQDYDMRGYWHDVARQGADQRAKNVTDGQMHFPDTYKTPFHKSFSAESKYANPNAPNWINDTQLVDADGNVVWDEQYFGRPEHIEARPLPPARKRTP